MRIAVRLTVAALLAGLGVWIWLVLHPSPEKAIRNRLAEAADCASFAADEGAISRMAGAQRLGDFLSSDAKLIVDAPHGGRHIFEGRDEITQAAGGARSRLTALEIEFVDLNVMLGLDKISAQVELTAKIKLPDEQDPVVQELRILLNQFNGDWVIARVETVKVLE